MRIIRLIDDIESLVLMILSHVFVVGYFLGMNSPETALMVIGLKIMFCMPDWRQFPSTLRRDNA